MLQRLSPVVRECVETKSGWDSIESLLSQLPNGRQLLTLEGDLAGCRVRKVGGRLFT
jgi:hypothetical protein